MAQDIHDIVRMQIAHLEEGNMKTVITVPHNLWDDLNAVMCREISGLFLG